MRIVVLGAGAIGSLFGAFLSKGNDVTLIGRAPHVRAVIENGLRIAGKTAMRAEPKAVTSTQECDSPDLLILTVKSYDTERAVREAKPLVGENTTVMSLQNGLGNLEVIRNVLGKAKIIGSVTSHGAVLTAPGVVEHTGIGDTMIGNFIGSGDSEAVAVLLTNNGIETIVSQNITEDVWYKALVNAAINPLAALARAPNGVLLEEEGLKAQAKAIVSEGVRVAAARGIYLNEDEAFSRVMRVATQTAENRNSMLQDLERGRRTEIDQINGAISRMGAEVGIGTPVNDELVARIKDVKSLKG